MLSLLSTACLLAQLSSGTVLLAQAESSNKNVPNPNHIFNAIHSSMRQWDSSIHHNGMSMFIATVPVGTQFYHGTHQNVSINGTEWLAFEPEHAMHFAGGRGPPPGGKHSGGPGEGPGGRPGDGPPNGPGSGGPPGPQKNMHLGAGKDDHGPPPGRSAPGWLHTYITNTDLRLLYFDGMSAAKADVGTLDTQDNVVLNMSGSEYSQPSAADGKDNKPSLPHHGPMGEGYRATELCSKSRNEWGGRIDGILRMEAGFEIILCDFAANLDLASMTRAKTPTGSGPFSGGGPDGLSSYKAITSRYHGIGGDRVAVSWDFVTAYALDLDIFNAPKADFPPRLRNVTDEIKKSLRVDVDAMVLREHRFDGRNWQRVSDQVVERYADRLKMIVDGDNVSAEISYALQPFIDFDARNATAEALRCVRHIEPSLLAPRTSVAAKAVGQTVDRICDDLVLAGCVAEEEARSIIEDLMQWLDWAVWKECRGCAWDEICFLPIWPQGGRQDYEQPSCKGREELSHVGGDYWRRW